MDLLARNLPDIAAAEIQVDSAFGAKPIRVLTYRPVTARTLARSPIRDPLSEGFRHFVTSMPAPVASGWSGCRVGLAPTGKRRLARRTGHATTDTDIRYLLTFEGRLELVKGIEPSYSAWKSSNFRSVFNTRSDILQLFGRLRSLQNFSLSQWRTSPPRSFF